MALVLDTNPPGDTAAKPTLAGLGRAALAERLAAVGVPAAQIRMRVNQLWSWIYVRGATSFEAMSDVSKDLRARLAAAYTLARPEIVTEQVSIDGTRKWLLRLAQHGRDARPPEIETVYIPETDRGTLCISSQVGCTLDLLLLPHRHAASRAQPRGPRDRRPDPARARSHRRLARRQPARRHAISSPMPSARSPTSC